MGTWLQESWVRGRKRLLLRAFRASGKSTLAAVFLAWLLHRDPDLRILVLAAESSLAIRMVRNIRKIIEKHPSTTLLTPTNRSEQWASERFTVNRTRELRDPSVLARGLGANITGSRADFIVCDDVEVPNNCDTPAARAALRETLSETEYILTPGGTQLYLGTPHSYYSIYADTPRKDIGEESVFLQDYDRYDLPLVDADGQSAWPERYSPADIARIRTQTGPAKFASQMMLEPVNIIDGRLDPGLMKPYRAELVYSESNTETRLHLDGRRMLSCSAWWDPAFGGAGRDRSVLAVVYTDETGAYWLHRVVYLRSGGRAEGAGRRPCTTGAEEVAVAAAAAAAAAAEAAAEGVESPEDEASVQCRQVAALAAALYIPSIAVETNGIGKFLPGILRRELAAARVPCAVREMVSSRAKDLRILEAFDAVLAARALFVHRSVYDTPFIAEMQEWRPESGKGHDDGLDAASGALSMEPVRLKRFYPGGRTSWQGGGGSRRARTDFNV